MFGVKCFLKDEFSYAKYKYNNIEFDKKTKEEFLNLYEKTVTQDILESEGSTSEESDIEITLQNDDNGVNSDMDGETRNLFDVEKVDSKGSEQEKSKALKKGDSLTAAKR